MIIFVPCSLLPVPYSLFPVPCSLFPLVYIQLKCLILLNNKTEDIFPLLPIASCLLLACLLPLAFESMFTTERKNL
ncbi:hypothetical protein [Moorena bouillonii]|uniref:hypothetical protein n=1 Tax=Moorena bouillonii TaxID=207920 RepID=UPI001180893C|nr:hypothetical protein [Moorena bouillonii]